VRVLAEGSHGPVDSSEGARLAAELRTALRDARAGGTVVDAWSRVGGGRILVLEVPSRAEADRLLAGLPGPDSQRWTVTELADLEDGLDRYLESLKAGPAT
jgi:hypothetical protein